MHYCGKTPPSFRFSVKRHSFFLIESLLHRAYFFKGTKEYGNRFWKIVRVYLLSALFVFSFSPAQLFANESKLNTALVLADILRAARSEIASQQPTINNELIGDKGLSGEVIQQRVVSRLQEAGKAERLSNPANDIEAQLINAQLESILEVIEENQPLINRKDIGFKGFVPAVFARLTNERFGEKVGALAEIKVTAPIDLIRNRKARPDKWERSVIETRFESEAWSKGQLYSEETEGKNGAAFRVMVPEYYGDACLACHGSPKGDVDVTGYPKEGGKAGDLGGSISITLYK